MRRCRRGESREPICRGSVVAKGNLFVAENPFRTRTNVGRTRIERVSRAVADPEASSISALCDGPPFGETIHDRPNAAVKTLLAVFPVHVEIASCAEA